MFFWIEALVGWRAGDLNLDFGSVINLHCGFMQVSHHLSLFKVELVIPDDHIYGIRTRYGGH